MKLALLTAPLLLYSRTAVAWVGLGPEAIRELALLELDDSARQRLSAPPSRSRSRLVMSSRLVRAILILPGTVLVVVPALILWLARGTALGARPAGIEDPRSWIGVLLFSVGLVFAIWTCRLFVTIGEGTPAPWDPPNKLVVRGPYGHVRNPMITSVLLMLAGEAVFLRSWALAGWLSAFFLANAIYFPLSEEKALERRFGDQYRVYKANVPRWIPRLRSWHEP